MGSTIFAVSATQMRELERVATAEFGLDPLQMLENAGRQVAALAAGAAGPRPPAAHRVLVLAGTGHNGAVGLAAARHLANWGTRVLCYLVGDLYTARPALQHQRRTLEAAGVGVVRLRDETMLLGELSVADLVLDALLATALNGPPRDPLAGVVRMVNAVRRPVLAVDLPTGLHPDRGEPLDPCVRAAMTATLGLPKAGLLTPEGRELAGELYVVDTGLPPAAVARVAGRPHRFPDPHPVRLAGPVSR